MSSSPVWVKTKTVKNGICCFSAYQASLCQCVQEIDDMSKMFSCNELAVWNLAKCVGPVQRWNATCYNRQNKPHLVLRRLKRIVPLHVFRAWLSRICHHSTILLSPKCNGKVWVRVKKQNFKASVNILIKISKLL